MKSRTAHRRRQAYLEEQQEIDNVRAAAQPIAKTTRRRPQIFGGGAYLVGLVTLWIGRGSAGVG